MPFTIKLLNTGEIAMKMLLLLVWLLMMPAVTLVAQQTDKPLIISETELPCPNFSDKDTIFDNGGVVICYFDNQTFFKEGCKTIWPSFNLGELPGYPNYLLADINTFFLLLLSQLNSFTWTCEKLEIKKIIFSGPRRLINMSDRYDYGSRCINSRCINLVRKPEVLLPPDKMIFVGNNYNFYYAVFSTKLEQNKNADSRLIQNCYIIKHIKFTLYTLSDQGRQKLINNGFGQILLTDNLRRSINQRISKSHPPLIRMARNAQQQQAQEGETTWQQWQQEKKIGKTEKFFQVIWDIPFQFLLMIFWGGPVPIILCGTIFWLIIISLLGSMGARH